MSTDNGTEYVFVLPDGSERYEIVFESKEVFMFLTFHHAEIAMPLKTWEARKQ